MRRRIGHIFCLFIMSVAVITSGCGKTTPGTTTKTTAAELPQRSNGSASASWVFSFENLTDLCAYSDVVATGVIDRMVDTTPGDGGNLVSTKWAFRIEKMLKGEATDEIVINQLGSPEHPGFDLIDDPLFLPGDRYLLFLRAGNPGVYFSFGPFGRYFIWNDKVYSMNYILPDTQYQPAAELNFNGEPLNDVSGKISGLMDSAQLTLTTGNGRVPADVMRYSAGSSISVDVTLYTGKDGRGKAVFQIDSSTVATGLQYSINPLEFAVESGNEYKSILLIQINPDLPEGPYQIQVKCVFADGFSVQRTINLNVDTLSPSG